MPTTPPTQDHTVAVDLLTGLAIITAAMVFAAILTHVYDLIHYDHRHKH